MDHDRVPAGALKVGSVKVLRYRHGQGDPGEEQAGAHRRRRCPGTATEFVVIRIVGHAWTLQVDALNRTTGMASALAERIGGDENRRPRGAGAPTTARSRLDGGADEAERLVRVGSDRRDGG